MPKNPRQIIVGELVLVFPVNLEPGRSVFKIKVQHRFNFDSFTGTLNVWYRYRYADAKTDIVLYKACLHKSIRVIRCPERTLPLAANVMVWLCYRTATSAEKAATANVVTWGYRVLVLERKALDDCGGEAVVAS